MNRYILLLLLAGFLRGNAQNKTVVTFNLSQFDGKSLKVSVLAPKIEGTAAEFIIPEIVPGTYMKVNYVRFYSEFRAYDHGGNRLKIKKKGNKLSIEDAAKLYKLEYKVRPSFGDRKIWDNILACGGTVFRKKGCYLINFQLITGYFKGYEKLPFEVDVEKPDSLYGATSLTPVSLEKAKDIYSAGTYAELIDRPVMFSVPDTVSFTVGKTSFHIAMYSELGVVNSALLEPRLERLMKCIDEYTGGLPVSDYHFLFCHMDVGNPGGLKRLFKYFGLGSALEHLHSSVYTDEDDRDTTYIDSQLNWICSHEFLHTWTPITIHSEKIENFNFEHVDMTENMWFYEGFTDYMSNYITQTCSNYGDFTSSLADAIDYASNRKMRSLTESSRNIAINTIFQALGKLLQAQNFYERGKLVAFCMDMELYNHSNGTYRLRDLMRKLYDTYAYKSFFRDDELTDILVANSYPDLKPFMDKYIKGRELPPYKEYLKSFGWKYVAAKEAVPAYAKYIYIERQKVDTVYKFVVRKAKYNTIGLAVKDTVLAMEGAKSGMNWMSFYYPSTYQDSITVRVKRGEEVMTLKGKASIRHKSPYAYIIREKDATDEQKAFYKNFFGVKEGKAQGR